MIPFLVPLAASAIGLLGAGVAWLRSPRRRARSKSAKTMRVVHRGRDQAREELASAEKRLDEGAADYAEHVQARRMREADVEELKPYAEGRMPWSALRSGGYSTVGDVADSTEKRLEAVHGVGEKGAKTAMIAAERFKDGLANEPVAVPRPDDEGSATESLVLGAHGYIETRRRVGPIAGELEREVGELEPRAERVRKGTRFFGFLFGPDKDEREAARAEADELHARRLALQEEDGVLSRLRRAQRELRKLPRRARDPKVQDGFRKDYADYASVMEGSLARNRRAAELGVEPGAELGPDRTVQGGVPREVAERVEAAGLSPDGLGVTLRGYQDFGARFLLVQRGTILGDEMGLGKTMQSLAAMLHARAAEGASRFLVVSPASILHNWLREVSRRTDMVGHLFHGDERDERLKLWIEGGGVAVTSFGTLRRMPIAEELARAQSKLDFLIVDEAHYCKNPDARRTQAIAKLASDAVRVCLMSGTPVENKPAEMRNLVRLVQPDVARSLSPEGLEEEPVRDPRTFRRLVAPVYLRRNQADVLTELPERIDIDEWVEPHPSDREAYREAVLAKNVMAMRQTATIGIGDGTSAKLDRLAELLAEYREDGEKVLIFSYFLDVLEAVRKRFGAERVISGSVAPADRQRMVDEFSDAEGYSLLLGQIMAAGVGLNVQAAGAVVLIEPQWKPSTEEQAIARAHRMGQYRVVRVHKLLARQTVDERMVELLAEKREAFDDFARESAVKSASVEATETELSKRVVEEEYARLTAGASAG